MGAAPIAESRDKIATMAADWHNVLCILKMMQDRALTGTPLHLRRAPWLPVTADYNNTMKAAVFRMIDDIFSTAVVEDGPG